MAQSENGVGISYKLSDGTMVWTRRDTWAEVQEDMRLIFGEGSVERVVPQLQRAWGGNVPQPQPVTNPAPSQDDSPLLTEEQVEQTLATPVTFQTCPVCSALKNKWVEGGFSQRTQKPYKGFFGCPTPGCKGR